jgi:ABC-type spermidine/putrescine transport system permease subunit I
MLLRRTSTLALLVPPLIFLLVAFLYPLGRGIWGSFFAPNFTISGYVRIWQVPVYYQVLLVTFKIGAMSTILCVLLGYVTAYYLSIVTPRVRRFLLFFVALPFILNVLVRNYVWIILLQRNGFINQALLRLGIVTEPLELMHNELGVLIGMVSILLPYMILSALSSLLAIQGELLLASESLGSGPLRTFWKITLPLSLPGAAAGALLTFIVSIGFYITPALLGGRRDLMISNLIAINIKETLNWTLAFSLANVLLICTLVVYFAYSRWLRVRVGPLELLRR